ncbi:glycosyltransferase family 1 protein [Paenibacillus dendritiformis]|uniref:Group 1 glycosyl transferase n=1 Tax=Paenibacillus dendritiformis C454 TaxID=1131935 RepID=H3SK43_9BACL|nr:glycosyltransferase family 1 protein [Paenibacillus dendritiformis]EHQ60579.1 group 1 glycosyl transferase [Paenibacillus dendritiformis C454]CAH8768223.1 glycosyltransferase family 1 protein [Paenibacillus dendritiformis]
MSGPVRVLHAVVNMNRGGAETLIMNLYRNLDRSKIQFDFLTCKPGVYDRQIERMGGKIYRIPYISGVDVIGYWQALSSFFKDHAGYRLIHAHMDKMSGWVLKAARQAGIPCRIAHSHNTRSEGGFAAKAFKWYAGQSISSSATHLLACSQAAARWLFKQSSDTAGIVKNGIEQERFFFRSEVRDAVRKELGIGESAFVLGHVGRFQHQKNHAYLIEVYAKARPMLNDSVLLLAGDGPLRDELQRQTERLKLENSVRFLGVRSDIDRLLQALDLFVFPSRHEGLPLTLVEAQGAGLPCIISDNVTREVDLGLGLIQSLSLKDQQAWVERVLEAARDGASREIPGDALRMQGYDIRDTARWLENYYLSMVR